MNLEKAWKGTAGFLGGFTIIVLLGKGVGGYLLAGMQSYVPNGIFLQGLVLGALNGMLAIGLVLVYRTNRIINFAQAALGAFAATVAAELVQRFEWPFYPSVVIGLVAAVGMSALVEMGVIRRFSKAPRLILTVATIGVAQIFGAFELALPALLNEGESLNKPFKTPMSFTFEFGQVIFTGDHLAVLVVTPFVLGGLVWFLRGTGYGMAARAAAEDTDRARLLGIRVKRVSMIVWMIAGGLSALTAILQAPITGFQFGAFSGVTLLAQALAAAIIGRMESLPVTFGAALLIGTLSQVLVFSTHRQGPDNGVLLLIVIVALLVQRGKIGRAKGADGSAWNAVQEVRPIPRELSHLTELKVLRRGGAAAGFALLAFLPFVLPSGRTSLASVIMIYAIVGISLVMLTGWAGNVSLGQWALVGLGALVSGKMGAWDNPPDFFLNILISGIVGVIAALVIGLPALRIKGLFLGVTTLMFAIAAGSWIFTFQQLTPAGAIRRPVMWGIWDVSAEKDYYFVCLGFLIFALWAASNLRNSRFGRVLVGLRDNEIAAQSLGVDKTKAKLLAFATSGFVAAAAGALYAYHQQQLNAGRFPADVSLLIFSMVVIGGMGSSTGAILGAIYVRGTQYFLPAQWQLLVTGFGMLLLLLVFPGGLGQIVYTIRDRYLRALADKHKILVPSLVADKRADEPEPPPDPVVVETTPDPIPADRIPAEVSS